MKEKWKEYSQKAKTYWGSRSKKQKRIYIFGTTAIFLFLLISILLFSRTNFEPLYTDLAPETAGSIKETLDTRGVKYEISNEGTTISVPKEQVDALKVELAAEGLPQDGAIDYSFIEDQTGFGMTDNEFSVMERAALQTELEALISNMDAVESTDVMINMPEEATWVAEEAEAATASVTVDLSGTGELDQEQVKTLYNLVSKSVPDLPVENIDISDTSMNYYTYEENGSSGSAMNEYEDQRAVQQDIEKDIRRDVQQMLGTVAGQNKVMVSVTTDIDFTKENREEDLVEPVDEETMEGIAVSAEEVAEAYEGVDPLEEGEAGAGEEDVANYPAGTEAAGDSERTEERINYEVNRIHKEIQESPYKLRDLGIQVMVEPPDPEDPNSLEPETMDNMQAMLETVISTSIDKEYLEVEGEEMDVEEKVSISSQTFLGAEEIDQEAGGLPWWAYALMAVGAVGLILLVVWLVRRKKPAEAKEETFQAVEFEQRDIPDLESSREMTEEEMKRNQLEKLAKEKPEEFSKLLRSWLSDD
jgi:flagellar M-ring protein FliF